MSGFDDMGVFFVDTFSTDDANTENGGSSKVNFMNIKKKLREFLRQFQTGQFNYIYRDSLRNNYNSGRYWLEVDLKDLNSYDEELGELVKKQPTDVLPLFEEAAKEVADEITRPRPEGDDFVKPIQVMLRSEANPVLIRQLTADQVAKLYKVSGIVVAATNIRAKATSLTIQCRSCRSTIPNIPVKPGLEGYALPRKCNADQSGRMKCPLDPFFVLPDSCKCVDSQVLKLQETPENVPNGEMPRHIQLYMDRYLCDKIVPGNRVTVTGIYSIKKVNSNKGSSLKDKLNIGIRQPYLRVVGIQIDTDPTTTTLHATNSNTLGSANFLTTRMEEEEEMRRLVKSPNIYDLIAKSIAPSIYGFNDVKKAIACLLFGGSRKRLPDGLTRRGDINILLLGDPGTAKSQLLKFVERVAPIGVYTSGKGSSAAGLTASVIRDPNSRNFMIEGGAMVLADGGVVCIDEFDKMREEDRVAIHEAMEQQTISIAKAGITTTLNSRCSVLAAANSIFGRWDDLKGDENIDFMPTILSRFDMIFIIKDEHNEARDQTLARHVMNVHMNANVAQSSSATGAAQSDGEISLEFLKKLIAYCRSKCGPRLGENAAEKLKSQYVLMRSGTVAHERDTGKRISIPITVRQLEAVVRISESLAKMRMEPFANDADVNEALRLFNVSTMSAAMSGTLSGVEGFTSQEDQEQLQRIERQIRRRFVVGSQVSENAIVQDLIKQRYSEKAIYKVLQTMIRRNEIQHRAQRKLLYRIR